MKEFKRLDIVELFHTQFPYSKFDESKYRDRLDLTGIFATIVIPTCISAPHIAYIVCR